MKTLNIFFFALVYFILSSCTEIKAEVPGLVTKVSEHSVSNTFKRAIEEFESKKIKVFEVIKHHEGAKKVDKKLAETVTIIFGNPELGTGLMKDQRSVAIDLPQKLLIYGKDNKTFVSYNHPDYLRKRHNLSDLPELIKMTKALESIVSKIIK